MKIKFTIIVLLLVLSSYVWTTKTEHSSSPYFHVGMTQEYESDNALNYAEAARQRRELSFGRPVSEFGRIVFLPLPFYFIPFIKKFIIIALIVIAIMMAPHVTKGPHANRYSAQQIHSSKQVLRRSFGPEFFEIGNNLVNHEKINALAARVEKSVDLITKL